MQDAVDLLHPLLTDTVDYVKQGALIATALVLMQQPEAKVPCLTASVSRRCRALAVHVSCGVFTLLFLQCFAATCQYTVSLVAQSCNAQLCSPDAHV
jgi:hypothetical protein